MKDPLPPPPVQQQFHFKSVQHLAIAQHSLNIWEKMMSRIVIICVFYISVAKQHNVPSSFHHGSLADIQKCPLGSFPCGKEIPLQCVQQSFQCDGEIHCDNGVDEDLHYCNDEFNRGNPHSFSNLTNTHPTIHNESYYNCNLSFYPNDTCTCSSDNHLFCNGANLSSVPQGIVGNLNRLILVNNSISRIPVGAFDNYTDLNMIHLEGNQLLEILPGMFQGLRNLTKLFLAHNIIHTLHNGSFKSLYALTWLTLDHNVLTDSQLPELNNVPKLRWIDLSHNNISLTSYNFPPLKSLTQLNLEHNCIISLSQETFNSLTSLRVLFLSFNKIERLHWSAFIHLESLIELELSHNRIQFLPSKLFISQYRLQYLFLNNNPISKLPDTIFQNLGKLEQLNLEDMELQNLSTSIFSPMARLEFIFFKKFYYCSFAPHVRVCRPNTDGVSSFEQLLVNPVLRHSLWIVAALTCLGNSLVLMGRFLAMEDNRVLSIFIRNLSAADLLMGIYLVVIGSHDFAFRDKYNQHANAWMSSWGCVLCGILALTSSETSVLMLAFMSIERCICIAKSFSSQISVGWALISVSILWISGLTLALLPLMQWSPNIFYGTNGMCFPLHIDDPFIPGWQYSTFVFIGVNLLCVVAIGIAYLIMFISIQNTRKSTPLAIGDREFAVRFFFIVLTDCLCWIPIILLKILAMAYMPVTGNLYAWLVVFILPINSAINPFLYTFTTPKFRSRTKNLFKAMAASRKSSSIIDTETTVAAVFKGGGFKINKTSNTLESRA